MITIADKRRSSDERRSGRHDFAPSRDGKALAYIARPTNKRNFQNETEVLYLDHRVQPTRQS